MTHTQTKQKPKLSTVPRGYWRNWWGPTDICPAGGWRNEHFSDGSWLGTRRYPSAETAEQCAREQLAGRPDKAEYLGPEFFPEDGEGS
jgi:hypothetical protein